MSTVITTPARAAIFRGAGRPQQIAEVVLGPLGPEQVMVEMRAVGVCGSDLHMINGDWVRARDRQANLAAGARVILTPTGGAA